MKTDYLHLQFISVFTIISVQDGAHELSDLFHFDVLPLFFDLLWAGLIKPFLKYYLCGSVALSALLSENGSFVQSHKSRKDTR